MPRKTKKVNKSKQGCDFDLLPYPYSFTKKSNLQGVSVLQPMWMNNQLVQLVIDPAKAELEIRCYGCGHHIKTVSLKTL
ncbi:MAG: hypothetical protein GF334_11040 [Candidatus Altiarchaeales archaeon]|nr:hypothetical protein [Candidatus Altiarchaeales archaeon]